MLGSINLGEVNDEAERTAIIEARTVIIDAFTYLNPFTRKQLRVANNGKLPISSMGMLDAMRALYSNKHIDDGVKIVSQNYRTLLIDPYSIDKRLENLAALKLHPQKLAAEALSHLALSIRSKVHDWGEVSLPDGEKLDAVHILNSCPGLIRLSSDKIQLTQAKIDDIAGLGLDAKKIIKEKPSVLGNPLHSIRSKLFLGEAAFRYWGADNARTLACALLDSYPGLVSNGQHKLRTLARIGSAILSDTALVELGGKNVRPMAMLNIEVTLAAYLTWRYRGKNSNPASDNSPPPKLETFKEWRALSRILSKKDTSEIKGIIDNHSMDTIAQFYVKGAGNPN
jgi:hypothetical protein